MGSEMCIRDRQISATRQRACGSTLYREGCKAIHAPEAHKTDYVMTSTSLLQIAPTIASYFNIHLVSPAHPIEQILKFAYSHYPVPHTVTLVVIDSLDLELYYGLGNELRTVHELVEQDGLLFECDTVSNHTTPAIASILTGLEPESHGILTSDDVGKSKIKSIPVSYTHLTLPTN